MSEPNDHGLHLPEGATTVFLAVVLGVSIIGFFTGTARHDGDAHTGVPAVEVDAGPVDDVPYARSYTELRSRPPGPSSGFSDDLVALAATVVEPGGSKEDALSARAIRRAYDGAPPRVPHPIRQDSAPECLACHDDGMTIRGRTALPMGHRELTSCTQCHVVMDKPMPGGDALPADPRDVDSAFVGLASPTAGPRAWSIAPPQIPHRTFMRERCEACHGTSAMSGMQSSHPWRQNCEQCHAGPADVDQRPGVERTP